MISLSHLSSRCNKLILSAPMKPSSHRESLRACYARTQSPHGRDPAACSARLCAPRVCAFCVLHTCKHEDTTCCRQLQECTLSLSFLVVHTCTHEYMTRTHVCSRILVLHTCTHECSMLTYVCFHSLVLIRSHMNTLRAQPARKGLQPHHGLMGANLKEFTARRVFKCPCMHSKQCQHA